MLLRSIKIIVAVVFSVMSLYADEITRQIIVDQFGYRPGSKNVVIFSDPQTGQNGSVQYSPGATFELKKEITGETVYSGMVQQWNSGKVHDESGDIVWWGYFSDYTQPGDFYVYDPKNDLKSYTFTIRENIYNTLLKTSLRFFYYQRCGTGLDAMQGVNWNHQKCHAGVLQDTAALRYTTDALPLNVIGGWHDAGDYNKYIPFLATTMWDLLKAYELRPSVFGDNNMIPESDNGVADVLDEIKWELDWMLRMQIEDGSVVNRVAADMENSDVGMPQNHDNQRFYTEPTTWATATFAAITAYASRIFASVGALNVYSDTLLTRAEKAWQFLESHPSIAPADGKDIGSKPPLGAAAAESDSTDDRDRRVFAAAELFRTTGEQKYKDYFDSTYIPPKDGWLDPQGGAEGKSWPRQQGYLSYTQATGADAAKCSEIKNALKEICNWMLGWHDNISGDDAYRSKIWAYSWGSNKTKGDYAKLLILAAAMNIDPSLTQKYFEAAEEYLHYIHGRNPLAIVYLTNMGDKGAQLGAERSVMEIYHSWFHDGVSMYDGESSTYGPVPGFLAGGPNLYYSGSISPPKGEPAQKSYKDWNTSWPEQSWEVTEPAIYYQASYTLLVSQFCTEPSNEIIHPEKKSTHIPFKLGGKGQAYYCLYSIDGKIIGKGAVPQSGEIRFKKSVTSGIYLLRLYNRSNSYCSKIIWNQ